MFLNHLLFVSQVTIVGIIRNTEKSMTNIQYKVDDMTGAPMDVKQWVDTEVRGRESFSLNRKHVK